MLESSAGPLFQEVGYSELSVPQLENKTESTIFNEVQTIQELDSQGYCASSHCTENLGAASDTCNPSDLGVVNGPTLESTFFDSGLNNLDSGNTGVIGDDQSFGIDDLIYLDRVNHLSFERRSQQLEIQKALSDKRLKESESALRIWHFQLEIMQIQKAQGLQSQDDSCRNRNEWSSS